MALYRIIWRRGGQIFPLTYYSIQEVLRYQKPKVIVCDLYYAIKSDKYGNVDRAHSTIDNFQWSEVKIKSILDCVIPEKWSDFFSPITLYHSRWKELKQRDFSNITNAQKGARICYGIVENEKPEVILTEQKGNVSPFIFDYIERIVQLCEENNISLVFTIFPYNIGNTEDELSAQEQLAIYNELVDLAEEKGIPCLNFFDFLNETNFDWETDWYDTSHFNYLGAKKLSLYMADYLYKNYNLKDRREEEGYMRWHDDYKIYKEELVAEKIKKITGWTVPLGYLKMLQEEEDFLVLMNYGGDQDINFSEKALEVLQELGIKNKFEENWGSSWIAVLDNGETVYEEVSTKKIQYEGEYLEKKVKLFSNNTGSYFHIIVDEKKVGKNKEGINIVVFSKSKMKVVDSITLDFRDEACKIIR